MNSINNKWMQYALNEAEKALKADEVPIGSIIVKENRIVGRGYNQVESLNDSTAHAEIVAITSAANTLNDWRLTDCSIYVTKEPCLMCYGAIVNSRIKNIFYGFSDKENGFKAKIDEKIILSKNHLNIIEGNILEYDCRAIVSIFFKSKRKKSTKNVE